MKEYELTRIRHVNYARTLVKSFADRLEWDKSKIHIERRTQLRSLLNHAKTHSKWYKEKLHRIDPNDFDLSQMEKIPVLTKEALMEHWDDFVTVPGIKLEQAEQHLESLETDKYFRDEYHIVASSGTTGRRTVFLYDWHGWASYYLSLSRWGYSYAQKNPNRKKKQYIRAQISAERANHVSSAITQTFSGQQTDVHRISTLTPLIEIVERLNAIQPDILSGYPSVIGLLAHEQIKGTLAILPERISVSAEPLLHKTKSLIEQAWLAPITNIWSCSEGAVANPCGEGNIHLNEDLGIYEFIDCNYNPVPYGTTSSSILFTNLYNKVLPLIRYQISDKVKRIKTDCNCGVAFDVIDNVQGRQWDGFVYEGGINVDGDVFWTTLEEVAGIVEYQIRQTKSGAVILCVVKSNVNFDELSEIIESRLKTLGLDNPEVIFKKTSHIAREKSGKLKRFLY